MSCAPPPRFCARALSHSLARKCFSDVSRNERNRPRCRVGPGDGVVRQQPREELLREVLRLLPRMPRAPHVSVKRLPVVAAKLLQRRLRPRGVAASRRQHHRPMRGDEASRRRLRRLCAAGSHLDGPMIPRAPGTVESFGRKCRPQAPRVAAAAATSCRLHHRGSAIPRELILLQAASKPTASFHRASPSAPCRHAKDDSHDQEEQHQSVKPPHPPLGQQLRHLGQPRAKRRERGRFRPGGCRAAWSWTVCRSLLNLGRDGRPLRRTCTQYARGPP